MKGLRKGNKAFQTIATDILKSAVKTLNDTEQPRATRVHEARKHFKELRGLLRLVRYMNGEKTYRKENRLFRDAGRPLSQVRDAQVMIQTLKKLRRHFKKELPKRTTTTVQRMLNKRSDQLTKRVLDKAGTLKEVSGIAKKGIKRIKGWSAQSDKWNPIGKGLGRTYEEGRSGLRRSLRHSTDEELHEWRKSVKYLRYQLEALSPLCPEIMDDLATRAHKLADLLGDDHDLVVLRDLISREFEGKKNKPLRQQIQQLTRKRRSELQKEAKDLGAVLYAEQPKLFEWRIQKYWDAWHK